MGGRQLILNDGKTAGIFQASDNYTNMKTTIDPKEKRDEQIRERQNAIQDAVTARMNKSGETYDQAWKWAQKAPEHRTLFEAMSKPRTEAEVNSAQAWAAGPAGPLVSRGSTESTKAEAEAAEKEAAGEIQAEVKRRMEKQNIDYDTAYRQVRNDPQFTVIFARMKPPGTERKFKSSAEEELQEARRKRGAQVNAAVARLEATGMTHDAAWNAVRHDPEYAGHFEAMGKIGTLNG
jgi:hypothetical protein